jgi:glycosyltransferase involved in cell wall biosynthesis
MEQHVKMLKDLGIVVIMDLDDYWSPGQHHPAYHIIKKHELDKKIVSNLKLADYVTTTTQIFANEINKFNKNTCVLPNAINPDDKQFTPNPESSERIRIGWLGGSSHARDLAILDGMVSQIKAAGLIDKVQFVVCGFDLRGNVTVYNKDTGEETVRNITPQESVWFQYEKIFTDNYSIVSPEYKAHLLKFENKEYSDIANEAYRRVWTKPVTSYASNYNLFDIALAPVEENIFNKVKSQLKVIEAGFHKKALVASDFGPYQIDLTNVYERGGEINLNGNAFLVDSSKNHKFWGKHLIKMIENPELIKTLATNLHNTVKDKYSAEAVSKLRRDFYLSVVKK